MPTCRNCNSRITKFDTDMCPVCGCKHPLEGMESRTVEITTQLDSNNPSYKKYRPTLRRNVFLCFVFVGFTGSGFFYQGYSKKGIIWLFANFALLGIIGTILALTTALGFAWSYLVMLLGLYAFNILVGLYFLFKADLKDARGEFLK